MPEAGMHKVGTIKTGKRGRPKTLFADNLTGALMQWKGKRSSRWQRQVPRVKPAKASTEHWSQRRGVVQRLVKRWITVRCKECGEIRYSNAQYRMEFLLTAPDGSKFVRSRHLRLADVKHPERAFSYEFFKVACFCLGKNSQPRRKVVEIGALALSAEYDRAALGGKRPVSPGNPVPGSGNPANPN